jgi:SPP1 family predicted phage head-tail adaptor
MRAGDLRRRVTFEKRSSSVDTFGQQQTTWATVLDGVPADIARLSGRELVAAGAINAEATHMITIRYHPAFADPMAVAAMRIRYVNGDVTRVFNIQTAAIVDERNRAIEIIAGEGLNQG